MFEAKAHIGYEGFKERLEFGLVAQRKIKEVLDNNKVTIVKEDFCELLDWPFPKIDKPFPDFETENYLLEVRRTTLDNFNKDVYLGYTKKADGWLHWSKETNKPIIFLMFNNDMSKIGFTSLNNKPLKIKQNQKGDIDYILDLNHFIVEDYKMGVYLLIKLLKGY